MSEHIFRKKYDLRLWDPLEEFFTPNHEESGNPFDINYRWYKKL